MREGEVGQRAEGEQGGRQEGELVVLQAEPREGGPERENRGVDRLELVVEEGKVRQPRELTHRRGQRGQLVVVEAERAEADERLEPVRQGAEAAACEREGRELGQQRLATHVRRRRRAQRRLGQLRRREGEGGGAVRTRAA